MKKILITGITAIIMCLAAGCQEKTEEIPPLTVETIDTNTEADNTETDNTETDNTETAADGMEENTKDILSNSTEESAKEPAEEPAEEPVEEPSAQEEWGDVIDIGENKLTVNKTFVEGNTAVTIVGEGAEPVTVYVSDTTVYEFQEVRNGGIHAEDITSREGSFDDIEIGSSLVMTGSWKDEDFYASEIIIYKFYH